MALRQVDAEHVPVRHPCGDQLDGPACAAPNVQDPICRRDIQE
jgi:hypothetical protein